MPLYSPPEYDCGFLSCAMQRKGKNRCILWKKKYDGSSLWTSQDLCGVGRKSWWCLLSPGAYLMIGLNLSVQKSIFYDGRVAVHCPGQMVCRFAASLGRRTEHGWRRATVYLNVFSVTNKRNKLKLRVPMVVQISACGFYTNEALCE